jgi:hypothetical protein
MLEESLYKFDEQSFVNTLEQSVSKKLYNAIKRELGGEVNGSNLELQKALLREIKTRVSSMEMVRLMIAVEPTERMISRIYKWVVDNLGPEKLLEFEVDKSMLGGARITYRGRFADFSWEKKWKEVWEEERKKLVVSLGQN